MRPLFLACLAVLTLAGCAEFQSQDDPFTLSRTPDEPVPQAAAVEDARIRVAIVVHQPDVRLTAPDAFILTGLNLEGTPGSDDGMGRRLKDIELTPRQIDGSRAVLTPQGQGQVEVDGKPYRGSIVILDNGDGTLTVVNDVDLEDYVMGVVAGEVPRDWPLEALKAQALAARTFAVLKHEQALQAGSPYDLENSSLFQMYKGSGALSDGIRHAVRDTQGEIITYHDQPIEAFFHSNCGGETCGAKSVWGQDKPYLKPVVCGFCNDGPHFRWTAEVSIPELVRKLRAAGIAVDDVAGLRVLGRDDSGRIALLGIQDGMGGWKSMKGSAFRMAVGPDVIRSTRFEAKVELDQVVFHGLGWGHGVGLCQEGACGMARRGYSAYDIIRHYYRGVLVEKMRAP